MLISDKQLIGLRVETASREHIGHVAGLEIDIESQSILNYFIRPAGLVGGLLGSERIVARGQVVSITSERMVVENGKVKETTSGNKEKEPFLSPKESIPQPLQSAGKDL